MTPAQLALWLLLDAEHVDAMVQLIASSDLKIVSDGEQFSVIRTHADILTHYETGTTLPMMPAAIA
jgi:hypothetical protein